MRDAARVRGVQRAADRAQDRHRDLERHAAVALEPLGERLALEVLHDVERAAVGQRAEREDVDDVAVADLVDRARLGLEPLEHLGVDREPPCEHLDRDLLADQRVARLEHVAEAAVAELGLDLILADDLTRNEVRVGRPGDRLRRRGRHATLV